MKCPQCQASLDVKNDVNLNSGLGRCPACQIVFNVNQKEKVFDKLSYVDPTRIEIKREYNSTVLTIPWKKSFFFLFFATFWNVITFGVLGGFFYSGKFSEILFSPAAILLVTHPTVGLITGYYAIASIVNQTQIKIFFDRIEVKAKPLPWFGAKTMSKHDIQQLFVQTYVAYRQNHQPVYRFKVVAQANSQDVDLIKGIDSYERAVSLEVEIERILNIQDQKVAGEHIPA